MVSEPAPARPDGRLRGEAGCKGERHTMRAGGGGANDDVAQVAGGLHEGPSHARDRAAEGQRGAPPEAMFVAKNMPNSDLGLYFGKRPLIVSLNAKLNACDATNRPERQGGCPGHKAC